MTSETSKNVDSLELWRALNAQAESSDRMAVDIGLFVLRICLTVNGGGLIALIALYPSITGKNEVENMLAWSGGWLLAGLIIAILSAASAYFYQSSVTASIWRRQYKAYPDGGKIPYAWSGKARCILAVLMIGFTFGSIVAFCIATVPLLSAF